MVGTLQPLDQKFPVVGPDGKPTLYFIRWAQQRMLDIGGAVDADKATEIAQEVVDLFDQAHALQAGNGIGITPDGRLSSDPTIEAKVQEILDQITTDRGSVLFRGVDDWQALAPGTSGNVLQTNGAGADPTWVPQSGGGGGGGGVNIPGPETIHPKISGNFGVNNFGGTPVYFKDSRSVVAIQQYVLTASATASVTPALYSIPISGSTGTLIASGPTVTGVTAGINTFNLSAPYTVPAGTFLAVGLLLRGTALSVALDTRRASVYFSISSNTPPATANLLSIEATWSSMWPI